MNILVLLSPEQWFSLILMFLIMTVSTYYFFNCGKRLSDRTMAGLFFVYAFYGAIRYFVLIYFRETEGLVITRNSALFINTLSLIKEIYMAIVALYLMLRFRVSIPRGKKEAHYDF
jgi:hypothetical protein